MRNANTFFIYSNYHSIQFFSACSEINGNFISLMMAIPVPNSRIHAFWKCAEASSATEWSRRPKGDLIFLIQLKD